jgi:hypothetical protein
VHFLLTYFLVYFYLRNLSLSAYFASFLVFVMFTTVLILIKVAMINFQMKPKQHFYWEDKGIVSFKLLYFMFYWRFAERCNYNNFQHSFWR